MNHTKFILLTFFTISILLLVAGCDTVGNNEPSPNLTNSNEYETTPGEVEHLAGIIEISGNILSITPSKIFIIYTAGEEFGFVRDTTLRSIEFIERNDKQRMAYFGLSFDDFMPSGWVAGYVYEIRTFAITDETKFVFVDNLLLFDTNPDGDRQYTTNVLDEFMQYFFPSVIHFIEVQDGNVIRLVQEFGFTM